MNSGAIKQDRQSNAGPFRVSDSTQSPLHAFHFRLQKIPIISRALQRHGNLSRFQLQQLIVAKLERFLHFAFYSQPPFVFVDLRDRKMSSDVKRFRRRDEAIELLERHLEIERLLASHNLAIDEFLLALHRLTPDLAKAKSKISNLKSKMGSGA